MGAAPNGRADQPCHGPDLLAALADLVDGIVGVVREVRVERSDRPFGVCERDQTDAVDHLFAGRESRIHAAYVTTPFDPETGRSDPIVGRVVWNRFGNEKGVSR